MSESTLNSIEKELKPLWTKPQAWPQISVLLQKVSDEKLWEEENDEKVTSFTKWLNRYAREIGVSKSYLWKVMKAGRVYANFQRRTGDANIPNIENTELSADVVVLADRIACGDPVITDQIITKVMGSVVTLDDMKKAWEKVRAEKEEAEEAGRLFEPYMPFVKLTKEELELQELRDQTNKALRADWLDWLDVFRKSVERRGSECSVSEVYRARLISGLKIHSLEFPEMLFENYTVEKEGDVRIHLIKTTIGDIEDADADITKYADICWSLSRERVRVPEGWGSLLLRKEEIEDEKEEEKRVVYAIELDREPTIFDVDPSLKHQAILAALFR